MKSKMKKTVIIIVCLTTCIFLAILHILNGGTIAVGTWRDTPFKSLVEMSMNEYIEYTEIKTVYLGEDGKDGAILFYVENNTDSNMTLFNMSFFSAKHSHGQYVYTQNSTRIFTKEILQSDLDSLTLIYETVKNGYLPGMTTFTLDEIQEKYPFLADITIEPFQFEFDGDSYLVNYICLNCETKEEAVSIAGIVGL